MSTETVILPNDSEPAVKPYMVECKFTVEHRESIGGDWERNTGGVMFDETVCWAWENGHDYPSYTNPDGFCHRGKRKESK